MRVLILSDIHANLVALETVLAAAAGRYDTIWCLGDIVGYGPRPNECVSLMAEKASVCVIGNHDWAALNRPGINVDDFNPHARQAVLWTQQQLTAESRAYLDSLPAQPLRPDSTCSLILTHASPREPVWEYILTPKVALENFGEFAESICLVGHTHKPAVFVWQLMAQNQDAGGQSVAAVDYRQPIPGQTLQLTSSAHQRLILNPGSVGQPRDNDARAAFALLDLESLTWRCEREPYPVELTQNQMHAARLPRRLIDRLSFGW